MRCRRRSPHRDQETPPGGAPKPLLPMFRSAQQEAQSAPPASGQLYDYVKMGSEEYKHEWKKAHNRLYKRQKRQGQLNNIQRQEVEEKMLSSLRAGGGPP